MAYDHDTIERKWQRYWKKNKTFKADIDQSKQKYYALDMFPYPSGQGLHVGIQKATLLPMQFHV